jgi:hypothetical protein
MKIKIIVIVLLTIMSIGVVNAQNNVKKTTPVGTWKFDAPYAPEGYNTGKIVVSLENKKFSTTMAFGAGDYKIPGEQVKAVKDSVQFSVFLEGQDIKVFLKQEDDSKMTGKAVYSEGEVPLTLSRVAGDSDSKK